MSFPTSIDAMAGGLNPRFGPEQTPWSNQRFGPEQTTWSNQFGLARKTAGELSPVSRSKLGMTIPPTVKPKRTPGMFGEDDDLETSMYFNMYRPDKDLLGSVSPSQLTNAFGTNLYGQGSNISGNPLPNLPQRGFAGSSSVQRNTPGVVTPTSTMNANFPMSMAQQQSSPNRSLISAIGQRGVISQSQVNQAISNLQKRTSVSSLYGSTGGPLTSSMSFGFPRSGEQPSGFDLSEFPSLGSRSISSNPIASARSYVGMVNKPVAETTPEFQIQQEDFPALPGAQNPPTSTTTATTSSISSNDARKGQTLSTQSTSYEQAVSKETNKFVSSDKSAVGVSQKRSIQIHPDGTVSNIPAGMVVDQFGIVGLLTFIRAAETDPNLVALAPGIDLTTLGLNLNSPENLYSTFQSPWADSPCRPQDIDFHVPVEYLTNIYIREKLAAIKLNRYSEDLLFFLFYMYGGDVLQLAASAELYTRDWRYHREERIWITRAPGCEPVVKTNSYERGTYYFFDSASWRKVAKEFHLEYDKLEERPHLPPTLHHNHSQPITTH